MNWSYKASGNVQILAQVLKSLKSGAEASLPKFWVPQFSVKMMNAFHFFSLLMYLAAGYIYLVWTSLSFESFQKYFKRLSKGANLERVFPSDTLQVQNGFWSDTIIYV